jgi:cobalt-zinc-cadmium efflux system outer membrane protein
LPSSHTRLSSTLAASIACIVPCVAAQSPLDVESYVQAVLRSHPAARQAVAADAAAVAERKAGRVFPDPVVGFTWDQASPLDGPKGTETGWSVSQAIPWPGTFSASVRAADQQAAVFRSEGVATRWELEIEARATFARLLHARAAVGIAGEAEVDALALKDLTARRAELGESREVDRIKTEVEWLRQQRTRRSLEREADAVEAILRNVAVEPLPRPMALAGELPHPLPPVDADDLRARLALANPRLLAAQATAARETALASTARRGRVPDLEVTWFRDKELDKTANGLQLGVKLPLWNANRGAIARAEASAALAAAGAARTLLDLTSALERARQELDVASAQAEILEERILPAAARSLELARFSYQEGETSLLDLLDAQRTFRETQREALASRLALALALADVRRLVGPDFNPGR